MTKMYFLLICLALTIDYTYTQSYVAPKIGKPTLKEICEGIPLVGHCQIKNYRAYYDRDTKQCKSYVWSGCGGTLNNFPTYYHCYRTCRNDIHYCDQPTNDGACPTYQAYTRLWYNPSINRCRRFLFHGCNGYMNNWKSKEVCERKCMKKDNCNQPPEYGNCTANIQRYYYNRDIRQCETFNYSGCYGNTNNYETEEECFETCDKKEFNFPEDKCTMDREYGGCNYYQLKYFFNNVTQRCDRFLYSSCDGNNNRFNTYADCSAECLKEKKLKPDHCLLPKYYGLCKQFFTYYYYNKASGRCEPFHFSTCMTNGNAFATKIECQNECMGGKEKLQPDTCKEPPDAGNCKGEIQRYYFDKDTETCKTFTYSGCGGNINNYKTTQECYGHCVEQNVEHDVYKHKQHENDVCNLPSDSGDCSGIIKRYFYYTDWMECIPFSYGGCNGSKNNFVTLEACEKICPSKNKKKKKQKKPSKAHCQLPEHFGNCDTLVRRFRFNEESKKCEQFGYSGCGGNENNFKRIETCNSLCMTPTTKKPDLVFKEE